MKRGAGVIAGLVLMAAAVRVVGGADGEGEGVPEVRVRIARFADDRPAAISYTFDDNLREQYTVALPMLNEVGFKGTFFVIAGKTAETPEEGAKKQVDPNVRAKWGGISWPELKKMADEGQEIGSHTWSHAGMTKLSAADVDAELKNAYDAIQAHIGKPPLTLAFPGNSSNLEVQAAALKYHVAFRSYQEATSEKSTTASLNAWADKVIAEKNCGVMMTHAITDRYAAMSSPEIFHAHLKYVKGLEGKVWVDTFGNVARYEKEADDAKLKVTGGDGSAMVVVSGTLDPKIYDVPLTVVVEAAGATSAVARRGGKALPVRVAKGAVYVQAAPGADAIAVSWKQ
jgi:peptidoglycan/xylan/chitin deacetylase (PgdA/CDA1 family)